MNYARLSCPIVRYGSDDWRREHTLPLSTEHVVLNAIERDQQRKEVISVVRIGRVILDENKVVSVMRENGTGNPVKTTVNLADGTKHEFNKYAQQAWDYFKGRVSRTVAG